MGVKTYIQLGRVGDILNVLPLLYADFKRGEKQGLMVAKEFAGLLDGISYVDPVVFDGRDFDIGGGVLLAEKLGLPWVCTQVQGPREACEQFVWGPANMTGGMTPSFQQEAFRACGRLKEWNDDLPLVFDRRNPEREAELIEKVFPRRPGKHKRAILVASDGVSSPFPYKKLLWGILELAFGKTFQLVDLGKFRLDHFHDFLGLYEKAHCLVTIDTGPLHLARAIPSLPVIALTADKPHLWNGSAWQPQHVFYCRYSDFPERAMDMVKAIEAPKVGKDEFVHVWNAYEGKIAPYFPCTFPTPIELGACGRDSQNTLKDDKRFPYLKDALKMGLARCKPNGFVCLTRPDTDCGTSFDTKWTPFRGERPIYAYRIDRNGGGDMFHPVIDLLCAKKEFWTEHMKEIPDLILGNDYYWSNVLWAMFKKYGAQDVTGCCWREKQ